MNRVRWGILSTAKIGMRRMIPAIAASRNGVVYAIASRSMEAARQAARALEIPVAYGRYEDLLADPNVDAIYIPLPNGLHAEWTIRAAESGKAVLCEKPLCNDEAQARQVVAAYQTQGVLLAEAFMYRYHPRIFRALELVRQGAVGEPHLVRAHFSFALDRPADPRWDPALAGGSLMDVGCYAVNISRLFLGLEPDSAAAHAVLAPTGVDESLAGVLCFPGGRLAVVDCSFRVPYSERAEVVGEAGTLVLERPFVAYDVPTQLMIRRGDDIQTLDFGPANSYTLMVEAFGRSVLDGEPFPYPASDAVANMRAIDMLYASTGVFTRISPSHSAPSARPSGS